MTSCSLAVSRILTSSHLRRGCSSHGFDPVRNCFLIKSSSVLQFCQIDLQYNLKMYDLSFTIPLYLNAQTMKWNVAAAKVKVPIFCPLFVLIKNWY